MLFTSTAARSTLLMGRASLVSSLQLQAAKRTFASAAGLTSQVASLKGVDFMSIDQLRCVRLSQSTCDPFFWQLGNVRVRERIGSLGSVWPFLTVATCTYETMLSPFSHCSPLSSLFFFTTTARTNCKVSSMSRTTTKSCTRTNPKHPHCLVPSPATP